MHTQLDAPNDLYHYGRQFSKTFYFNNTAGAVIVEETPLSWEPKHRRRRRSLAPHYPGTDFLSP